jgi:hypothetical protein
VRRRKGTAGVASVAKAMAPTSEFGFRALILTGAEFRLVESLGAGVWSGRWLEV